MILFGYKLLIGKKKFKFLNLIYKKILYFFCIVFYLKEINIIMINIKWYVYLVFIIYDMGIVEFL